jgi:CspA family cold shock protein
MRRMVNKIMNKGTVKWFDAKKGFGFILDSETEREYFVHFSDIHGDGFKKLFENDRVTFEVQETDKGLNAVNVIKEKRIQ